MSAYRFNSKENLLNQVKVLVIGPHVTDQCQRWLYLQNALKRADIFDQLQTIRITTGLPNIEGWAEIDEYCCQHPQVCSLARDLYREKLVIRGSTECDFFPNEGGDQYVRTIVLFREFHRGGQLEFDSPIDLSLAYPELEKVRIVYGDEEESRASPYQRVQNTARPVELLNELQEFLTPRPDIEYEIFGMEQLSFYPSGSTCRDRKHAFAPGSKENTELQNSIYDRALDIITTDDDGTPQTTRRNDLTFGTIERGTTLWKKKKPLGS